MGQVAHMDLDVVRVSAVDAKRIPEQDVERLRQLSSGVNSMSPAEIACLQSHRKAWQMIADGDDEWGFVAEDDIHLSADAANFFKSDRWIPANAEVIRAETDLGRAELSYRNWGKPLGHELRQLKSAQLGAAGYFLSKMTAVRVLEHTSRHVEPADVILFSSIGGLLTEMQVLQMLPALCVQDMWAPGGALGGPLTSQIDDDRRRFHRHDPRSARRKGTAKLVYEVARIGRQFAKPFRMAMLVAVGRSVFKRVEIETLVNAGPLPSGRAS